MIGKVDGPEKISSSQMKGKGFVLTKELVNRFKDKKITGGCKNQLLYA